MKWISTAKEFPKHNKTVLIAYKIGKRKYFDLAYYNSEMWLSEDGISLGVDPLYWANLIWPGV